MLESLLIKNYALLADVEITFGAGLNVLTGETGAGKSIIVGALGTILGERCDTSVVRRGSSKAVVEGGFNIKNCDLVAEILQKNDLLSEEELLILRREIFANGRSRAFVNDSPVPLAVLQAVGDVLVDLHGQHDHQSLLKTEHHLFFVDQFGKLDPLKGRVGEAFKELRGLLDKLSTLREQQHDVQAEKDRLQFQISEIEQVGLTEEEEETLIQEERILQNHERLFTLTDQQHYELYEKEGSVFEKLNNLELSLAELSEIDDAFSGFASECESAKLFIDEIAKYFQSYRARLDFDPERVEHIQKRIAEITSLKKKYSRTVAELLAYRDEMRERLGKLQNLDTEIDEISREIDEKKQRFSALCIALSERRAALCRDLEERVPDVLEYLGMPGTRFTVALEYQDDPGGLVTHRGKTYRATADGMDIAQFLISTNTGENPKPLAKIASGGEISRIMLALKSLLAKQGSIPVLVFDEIDNGISGRIAQAVGRKLKALSDSHQVICITHLPQIAGMGEYHLFVEKVERDARTETKIRRLNEEERALAIARLLAGDEITDSHLKSARELMAEAARA